MADAVTKIREFERFGSILGLERVNELLHRLGDPQLGTEEHPLKYIHVTGTNGKGSTCRFMEKGLAACGYKVGLYTSPYIEKFNERIQVGGRIITDEELDIYGERALAKAAEMVSDGLDSPTEFEVVMAAAFLFFRDMKPDIVILEAGMGGIGDATNVILSPMASVFTNVSYDHMHILGNTLEEIATDKAGIIKRGSPVISNVKDHGPAAVIARTAYEKGSRLYDVSKVKPRIDWVTPEEQQVSMQLMYMDYGEIRTRMIGAHQAENLKTALATLEVLRRSKQVKLERTALYEGIREAFQPVRFEVLKWGDNQRNKYIVLDGAHNEAGARALSETMKIAFADKRILLVTGMVEKKETDKVIAHLMEIGSDFIATQPDYEGRAMSAETFAEHIRRAGEKARQLGDAGEKSEIARGISENRKITVLAVKTSPSEAVKEALKHIEDYDVVLFTGSLYLAGEVRSILGDSGDYDYDRTLKYGNRNPQQNQ